MARQQAQPRGPRGAGPAARGRGGRPGARGLGRAGVRGPRAAASRDAPPPPPLLLGLLLLAALPRRCLADPGKHSAAASRPRGFLEERGRPSGPHLAG